MWSVSRQAADLSCGRERAQWSLGPSRVHVAEGTGCPSLSPRCCWGIEPMGMGFGSGSSWTACCYPCFWDLQGGSVVASRRWPEVPFSPEGSVWRAGQESPDSGDRCLGGAGGLGVTGKGRSIHIWPAAAQGQGRRGSLFGWERYCMSLKVQPPESSGFIGLET